MMEQEAATKHGVQYDARCVMAMAYDFHRCIEQNARGRKEGGRGR
jgi:hypothetical protein